MTTIANTAQAEAWNGYEGSHWAEHRDRYDAVNSGFNDHLLRAAAIGDRSRVLDVGCGTGQISRLAARSAGRVSVLGLDLSAPMLPRARAVSAAEGIGNVTFEQGDAQAHPLPAAAFDVVVSRFGIMFFGDAVAAFANIGRSLRPGGRLAVLAMRRLADHDLGTVLEAAAAHVPALGVSADGGPDSFDPSALEAAGLAEIEVAAVDAVQVWGSDADDAGAFFAEWGPVRHHLGLVSVRGGRLRARRDRRGDAAVRASRHCGTAGRGLADHRGAALMPRRAAALRDSGQGLRDHLIAAAERLILRRGTAGLTVRDIAEEAAVATGVLYNHFADREELLALALHAYVRTVEGSLSPAPATGDAEAGLLAWIERSLAFHQAILPAFAGLVGQPKALARFAEISRAAGGPDLRTQLADHLRDERALGRIAAGADVDIVATMVIGACHELVLPRVFAGDTGPLRVPPGFAAGLARTIVDGIRP